MDQGTEAEGSKSGDTCCQKICTETNKEPDGSVRSVAYSCRYAQCSIVTPIRTNHLSLSQGEGEPLKLVPALIHI